MNESAAELFIDKTPDEPQVRGFLHRAAAPSGDALVLTHGAGGNCEAPLLVALAHEFSASGLTVLRCDLPFRQLRPHGPPPIGSSKGDQDGLRRAVALLRQMVSNRVFLGGHSYGGRQASMLVASDAALVAGLLLLSYPLHPPRRPAQLRTAHFPNLRTPALFVHGTRDPFGLIPEMKAAIKLIPAQTQLLPVEGAGHDLLSKRNRDELPKTIAPAFQRFLLLGN